MAQTVPAFPKGDVIVVGGDRRQRVVCIQLAEAGFRVAAVGLGSETPSHAAVRRYESVDKALEQACLSGAAFGSDSPPCAVILPLPATRDGETVWCPCDPACRIPLERVAEWMSKHPRLRLFGGCMPPTLTDPLAAYTPDRCTDYYKDETVQIRNAYLTAEAALMLAMEQTDRAVREMTVGVIGYGRIGHMLAHILTALGASVTVCARRAESRAWAACEGCRTLPTNGIDGLCHGFDVIYNTVPTPVLGRDVLLGMDPETLLVDLASAPGGASPEVIRDCAERRGLRYLRAPSLPGRYAPDEAGRILAESILAHMAGAGETEEKGGQET